MLTTTSPELLDARANPSTAKGTVKDFKARLGRPHPRVLLAEDDDDFRSLLRNRMEADGYQVTAVSSGIALLDQLNAVFLGDDPPDLVISDDRMPGIRGLQVLRQARDYGLACPIVLITAFGTAQVAAEAERAGVAILRKPFDIDDFRTLVGWLAPRNGVAAALCEDCGRNYLFQSFRDPADKPVCGSCCQRRSVIEALFEKRRHWGEDI